MQVAGLDLAVRPALEIRIKTFPVLHYHIAGAPRRHALLGTAVDDGRVKVLLRQRLERVDQRGSYQTFLFGAMAAFACQCSPRLPTVQSLGIDFVGVLNRIRRS